MEYQTIKLAADPINGIYEVEDLSNSTSQDIFVAMLDTLEESIEAEVDFETFCMLQEKYGVKLLSDDEFKVEDAETGNCLVGSFELLNEALNWIEEDEDKDEIAYDITFRDERIYHSRAGWM